MILSSKCFMISSIDLYDFYLLISFGQDLILYYWSSVFDLVYVINLNR